MITRWNCTFRWMAFGLLIAICAAHPARAGVDDAIRTLQTGGAGKEADAAVQELVQILRQRGKPAEQLQARLGEIARQSPGTQPARLNKKLSGLCRVVAAAEFFAQPTTNAASIKVHPWAAVFPGAVPADAKRVSATVKAKTRQGGWQSTGLYAPAGEPITIELPDEQANAGWAVRIGAHTDGLWSHEQWARFPEVSGRFPLSAPKTVVASRFGGLVYLIAPSKGAEGSADVKLTGAVESPQYILGVTDTKAWREEIRLRPGPWAELITDKIILTVPSKAVRELDDPEALMRFWDRVLDADADLAGRPRERAIPERVAADIQISAGYMHSGYPIMAHMDAAGRMVDLKLLSSKGDWGLFHEMGHNHQSSEWTFGGTVEVTCNLFTVYVMETVCTDAGRRKGLSAAENLAKLKAQLAKGSDFEAWQKDPFLALSMYMQLRDAFGWEAYRKVFAEYRALAADQRPRGDQEKRDQWMMRMSRASGHDLGPFFTAWGVRVSENARAAVKNLPAWMPEGLTMPATTQAARPGP